MANLPLNDATLSIFFLPRGNFELVKQEGRECILKRGEEKVIFFLTRKINVTFFKNFV